MKTNQFARVLGLGSALIIPMTSAHPHFLWGHVTTGAKPTYRLTISETPVEGTDSDHSAQAKGASAWTVGGKDLQLSHSEDFLVAPLTASDKIVAAGYSWGVYPNKDKKSSYLLDLYAKAAVTEAAAAESANLPVEVFARRTGKEFVATIKNEDKPLAKAEVVVVTPDTKEEKTLTTDKNGSVRFPFTKAGLYTVRAINVTAPRSGAHNGKRYTSVLRFSTLTFTAS